MTLRSSLATISLVYITASTGCYEDIVFIGDDSAGAQTPPENNDSTGTPAPSSNDAPAGIDFELNGYALQLTQVTSAFRNASDVSIDSSGRYVAFSTDYDYESNIAENLEVVLYDTATKTFQMLTNTPEFSGNFSPRVLPEGRGVVFQSAYDFTGGNPDRSFELYAVSATTGQIQQLTNNGIGQATNPVIAHNGRYIAYRSNGDQQNPNGRMNCMRLDLETLQIQAITQIEVTQCREVAISGDGNRIAFVTAEDLLGQNSDTSSKLYIYDVSTQEYRQVTSTQDRLIQAISLSADGNLISYVTDYDQETGSTLVNTQVFLADVSEADPVITQVTPPSAELFLPTFTPPVLSPGGEHLFFETSRDVTGENPQRVHQLFLYQVGTGSLMQVTASSEPVFVGTYEDENSLSAAAGMAGFAYRSSEDALDPNTVLPEGTLQLHIGRWVPVGRGN